MKVTKHVERPLRQGRDPKELVKLGFAKSVVTRMRRRLREEKAAARAKGPKGRAGATSCPQPEAVSAAGTAPIQQELAHSERHLQKADNLAKLLPEVTALVAVAQELGADKREDCPYYEDPLRTLITWSSQGEIPKGVGEPVLVEKGKRRWQIKPSSFYCAMCTTPFECQIDEVETDLLGDPLSRAKYEIICKNCGSKGWVATAVKCTRCGTVA